MGGHALVRSIAVLAGFVVTAGAADIAQQIRAEIQRVRDLASNGAPDPRFKDLGSHIEDTLKSAAEDVTGENPYSGLEKLSQASDLAGGMRAASNDAAAVKGGMPAFEIECALAKDKDHGLASRPVMVPTP